MSLTADKRYALDRMNATAIKHGLGTELSKTKNNVRGVFDFAVSGGAVSQISILDTDGNAIVIPSGAIITNVIVHVITAVTTSASGTLGLTANSASDLCGDTAAGTLTLNALVAGVPVGTAATSVRMTADRTLKAEIKTGALTAGKVAFYVNYMLGE
jgi:hypothetical protein